MSIIELKNNEVIEVAGSGVGRNILFFTVGTLCALGTIALLIANPVTGPSTIGLAQGLNYRFDRLIKLFSDVRVR